MYDENMLITSLLGRCINNRASRCMVEYEGMYRNVPSVLENFYA
jgi:hypothetical protein